MFNNDFDDYDDSSCEEGIDFEQDENTEIDEEISAGCDKENVIDIRLLDYIF